jgi:hypothetical protein
MFSISFLPICIPFHFNWILFHALNWIELNFNSSCIAMLFIFELHIGMNYIFHLKTNYKIFLIHKNICYFLVFLMLFVLVKKGRFIACYILHHIIITFWPKFIYIKII